MRLNMKPWVAVATVVIALFATARPAQALIDADADGFSQAADCNDGNSQIWATPGEVLQLSFTPDKVTLSWAPPASLGGNVSSVRYDTLRSNSPSNFAGAPPASVKIPKD